MARKDAGIACEMCVFGGVAGGSQACNICFLLVKLAEVKRKKELIL